MGTGAGGEMSSLGLPSPKFLLERNERVEKTLHLDLFNVDL